ncbi:MAG TPA: hypothetical protein VD971_09505 [Phycisphaerales bacterium]|nr:hypothetical protein [Phycisphaerales bacterium]
MVSSLRGRAQVQAMDCVPVPSPSPVIPAPLRRADDIYFAHANPPLRIARFLFRREHDDRGAPTLVIDRRLSHLSDARRQHLWSAADVVAAELSHAASRHVRRMRTTAGFVAGAGLLAIAFVPAQSDPELVRTTAGMLPLLGCGIFGLGRYCDAPWRQRRAVILAHGRCPCCLEALPASRAEFVECSICRGSWLTHDLPRERAVRAFCRACHYNLSACPPGPCPECGDV